eukprot:405045_1
MTALKKFNSIKSQYILSIAQLNKIRNGFIEDMMNGLSSNGANSSCKMLPSRVISIPNGTEKGIFYAIDWGGTNYRIIRMQLYGNKIKPPKIDSISYKIPSKYKTCSHPSELFDYVAILFKKYMQTFNEHQITTNSSNINRQYFDVGFTFSFALKKRKLDEGILIAWDKGFHIDNVVGKDIVKLMNNSFKKFNIPARIKAICNDTIGTLLSSAYYNGINSKISVIIGTGTNAAYIEPDMNNEIINIEWCYFDAENKYLPRIKSTDLLMDLYTTNCGEEYTEKMISGMYIAEIIRLLFLQVFEHKLVGVKHSIMLDRFGEFTAVEIGKVLMYYYNGNYYDLLNEMINKRYGLIDCKFDENDCKIFGEICELIVNRSADLVATLLLGVLEKIKFFEGSYENGFVLIDNDKCITIGIDGSVYLKMPRYAERMDLTMRILVGEQIVDNMNIVHAKDGSGIGAALCVAALRRDIVSKL